MESHEKLTRERINGSQLDLKLGGAALGNHLLGNEIHNILKVMTTKSVQETLSFPHSLFESL